jgi:hypothetical protein
VVTAVSPAPGGVREESSFTARHHFLCLLVYLIEGSEIAKTNKRLNGQCLAWNEMRIRPRFLILKRAVSVFRKNPKIKQRILSTVGK